jgi:hypothetical protein
MGKNVFDLVFSLGSACSCSSVLRSSSLQFASFPLDWVSGSTLRKRVELLTNNFAQWLEEEDLKLVENLNTFGHDTYTNTRTGLCHPHDFDKGIPLCESLPAVKAKYSRRIDRLVNLISSSKHVLTVWVSDPRDGCRPSDEDIIWSLNALGKQFPNQEFRMLVLECLPGIDYSLAQVRHCQNFDIFSFDYRLISKDAKPWDVCYEPIKAVLSSFSCKDYRTAAEKRNHKEAKRKRAYARFAATSAFSYAINKIQFNIYRHLKRNLEKKGLDLLS